MKLKMKHTRYGSADGMRVDEYKKGETYDLPEQLAEVFVQQRWATRVVKTPCRTKDRGAAPENKSVKSTMKCKTKRGGHGA